MCQRCEELEAEVVYLQEQLGQRLNLPQADRLRVAFKITGAESMVLSVLYSAVGWTPAWDLHDRTRPDHARETDSLDTTRVRVSRLRARLGAGLIESEHSQGYRMSEDGRAMVRQALEDIEPIADLVLRFRERLKGRRQDNAAWPKERGDQLRGYAQSGFSIRQAAEKMKITSGMVAGYAYRHKIKFRGQAPR